PPPNLPYFVGRSRLHNLPVYLHLRKGNQRLTMLRRVQGDIWPLVQVNEVTGTLRFKGYWGEELRAWLLEKGF
ncbi:PREDICTED: 39S ribosomal protein L49, mitochondrial, partial [Acanthisitta chloris]|uniref:39S ribosomal protein L49, mitochondrial n=1 Tax=Acanthisitta chloris TaxID=57068 RepID=UPI0004F0E3D3